MSQIEFISGMYGWFDIQKLMQINNKRNHQMQKRHLTKPNINS